MKYLRKMRHAYQWCGALYDDLHHWWFNRLHHRVESRSGRDFYWTSGCSCGSGQFPCEARRDKRRREGKFDGSV